MPDGPIDSHELFSRAVLLSNGRTVPMETAVRSLLVLERWAQHPTHKHLLYDLREACLGRAPLPDEDRDQLHKEKFLSEAGTVSEEVRAVVLAAVRGVGAALTVDRPFTAAWDQTVAEMLMAHDTIYQHLGGELAELLLKAPDGNMNTVEDLCSWVEAIQQDHGNRHPKRRDLPPPASRN